MRCSNPAKRKQDEGLFRPKRQDKFTKSLPNFSAKKSLVIKGVPAEVSEQEFKEFLDLNKINYAIAEQLISKKDGRVLEIF